MSLTSAGCDFCSGWVAGMAGLVVGHPIDTLKVRQQIQGKRMLETVTNIYKTGGTLTFFRGMGVPLLTNGALNSVFFGFYGSSLDQLMTWRWFHKTKHKMERWNDPGLSGPTDIGGFESSKCVKNYMPYFLAGCVGGAAQLVLATPVDLVKVQLQSQIQKSVLKGPMDCAIKIVTAQGVLGLYKGFVAQALRDIPASGFYFMLYELLKHKFSLGQNCSSKFVQFVAGGLAGVISWWTIIPLDVIKSRIQGDSFQNPKYNGIVHCGSVIFKMHGMKGFFRGFLPLSLRAFPVNGTTFLVYEYLFGHCKQYQESLYA